MIRTEQFNDLFFHLMCVSCCLHLVFCFYTDFYLNFLFFVLVAVPESLRLPPKVRVSPAAAARTKMAVSEAKPYFEKRILEERDPFSYSHVNDDWFVLLGGERQKSGIFIWPGLVCASAGQQLTCGFAVASNAC